METGSFLNKIAVETLENRDKILFETLQAQAIRKKDYVCAVPGGPKKAHPGGRKCIFFLCFFNKNSDIFQNSITSEPLIVEICMTTQIRAKTIYFTNKDLKII